MQIMENNKYCFRTRVMFSKCALSLRLVNPINACATSQRYNDRGTGVVDGSQWPRCVDFTIFGPNYVNY